LEDAATDAWFRPDKLPHSGRTRVVELEIDSEHHIYMTARAIVAFWNTTADCLVEFFDIDREEALATLSRLRAKLAEIDNGSKTDRNLIYHSEPIHIASDLVGREPVRDELFYETYRRIQERNLKLKMSRRLLQVDKSIALSSQSAIRRPLIPRKREKSEDELVHLLQIGNR
jgi:hypothetical protein